MDIRPDYEIFGREIPFERITPITRIDQPGIFNRSTLFDSASLRVSLESVCSLLFPQNEVLVYFRNVVGGVSPKVYDEKRKWWDALQTFASQSGKDFPAGLEMEYWYGSDGKEFTLPELKENNPPYQAFVRLFGNAVQDFLVLLEKTKKVLDFLLVEQIMII